MRVEPGNQRASDRRNRRLFPECFYVDRATCCADAATSEPRWEHPADPAIGGDLHRRREATAGFPWHPGRSSRDPNNNESQTLPSMLSSILIYFNLIVKAIFFLKFFFFLT